MGGGGNALNFQQKQLYNEIYGGFSHTTHPYKMPYLNDQSKQTVCCQININISSASALSLSISVLRHMFEFRRVTSIS